MPAEWWEEHSVCEGLQEAGMAAGEEGRNM